MFQMTVSISYVTLIVLWYLRLNNITLKKLCVLSQTHFFCILFQSQRFKKSRFEVLLPGNSIEVSDGLGFFSFFNFLFVFIAQTL